MFRFSRNSLTPLRLGILETGVTSPMNTEAPRIFCLIVSASGGLPETF